MPNHPHREDIRLLDRFFYLDPWKQFKWMRDEAPAYWDPSADGDTLNRRSRVGVSPIAKGPTVQVIVPPVLTAVPTVGVALMNVIPAGT